MPKAVAIIQLIIVLAIIAYGTSELFKGNFAAGMTTFPLLVIFYLFLTFRKKAK